MVDVHASAVVSVRCFVQGAGTGIGGSGGGGGGGDGDPAAVTADVEGVVNKLCFRRVMWSKWVVDTECLLDGEWRGGLCRVNGWKMTKLEMLEGLWSVWGMTMLVCYSVWLGFITLGLT